MEIKVIPLIGNLTTRGSILDNPLVTTKGQLFMNCDFYQFKNPYTNGQTIYNIKRQGINNLLGADANYSSITKFFPWWGYNASTGSYVYGGVDSATGRTRISVPADAYNYVYASGTSRISGVNETKNSSGTDSLIFWRWSQSDYYLYPRGGAMTALTVPAGTVGPLITMKGWTFAANSNGRIYNSALNDPTTGYTDFIGADIFPDGILYLADFKNYLIAFGPASMEFFEVSENTTGSPLRYIPALQKRVGIASGGQYLPYSIGNDSLFFIGYSPELNIFQITPDYNVKPLLTPYQIDTFFRGATIDFVRWGNKNKLILSTSMDSLTTACVYDFDVELWHLWRSSSIVWSSLGYDAQNQRTMATIGTTTRGIVTGAPPYSTYQDSGSSTTRTIITGKIDFETNKYKTIHYIKLIGDMAASSSLVSISWSDDDGVTFNTAQTVDLAGMDPVIWGCGVTRRRVFKIEDSLDGEFRLEALEVGYTEHLH